VSLPLATSQPRCDQNFDEPTPGTRKIAPHFALGCLLNTKPDFQPFQD
jgi:hypothetical protein